MNTETLYDQMAGNNDIIFKRSVAATFGLNEAIAHQQLVTLIKSDKAQRRGDGRLWVASTWAEWGSKYFPFWSRSTIKRTFKNLEEKGMVDIGVEHAKSGAIEHLWFTINSTSLHQSNGEVS